LALGASDRRRDRALARGALEASWKQRAGTLATRDAAQWYETLVFDAGGTLDHARPAAFALGVFYELKRLIPRSRQLTMRRRLIARQGDRCFRHGRSMLPVPT